MKKALLFSGGYDSTLLLNRLMKEEDEVAIISIESSLLGSNKNKREKEARTRIINYLSSKYYNCKLDKLYLNIELSKIGRTGNGLAQPLLWLPAMQLLVNDNYELNFSYICGDQATAHLDDFKNILKISYKFWHGNDQQPVEPKFPLLYYDKAMVINELYHEDKFLFENATSCENYDSEAFCGKCVPCSHLKNALIQLCCNDNKYEVSDDDKAYYKQFLLDKFNVSFSYTNHNDKYDCSCNTVDNNNSNKEVE